MNLTIRTPPELALLLERVPHMSSTTLVSWATLRQANADPVPFVRDRMCRDVASTFAVAVANCGEWSQRDGPDGLHLRVDAYVLTFSRLVDLMQQAYNAGYLARPSMDVPRG